MTREYKGLCPKTSPFRAHIKVIVTFGDAFYSHPFSPAQKTQVLLSRLPRSGMVISSKFLLHLWLAKPTVFASGCGRRPRAGVA